MDNINRPRVTLGKDDVSSFTPPNVNTPCKPSSGAIPKKRSTQKQLHKADDQEQTDTGSEIRVAVPEDFSQLSVSGLDTTIGERTEKIEKNYQSLSGECPPQSLPPSEDARKDDVAKEFNRLLLNVKFQQPNSSPKGPHSPEEVFSTQNHAPVVTGLLPRPRMKQYYMAVGFDGREESGCPAENDELLDKDTEELIRKTDEMYIAKEKECKKLVEYIWQQDERNDKGNIQVVLLKQENKELSEELHSAVGKIETQRLANEQKLQEEHGKFQISKKTVAEEFKGFRESKRGHVKTIQVKLTEEKRKIKRMKIQLARERCQRKRVERELARAKSKEKKMEKRNEKKMEDLKQSESFLVQELRKKTVQLDICQAQYTRLQQDLEEFRAQITAELQSVQTSSAEWQRRFQGSTELIAETQELCRKATQMYLWKEQECERLKEHIEQNEQRYDECNRDLENLGREYEEQQEELHLAFKMVEELQLEYNKRKECEYNLDRRMVEMSQAFCKAESDRMKIMKVKLAEKIRQRKKMKRQLTKERNKRKRVELEKAIEKRRGKRMEKRKKEDRCQCLRTEKKGEGPSGGTRGGYGGHVSRDEGDLSSIASSEEESSEREITTGPDDSLENEDTK